MKSFTQKMYDALVSAHAISQSTGLTAVEVAERTGQTSRRDKRMISTVLGNLARRKLANRALEGDPADGRREYRYWLVKMNGHPTFRGTTRPTSARIQSIQEPEVHAPITNGNPVGAYLLSIIGPSNFRMVTEIPSEKLTSVIAAANGGK